MRVSVSIDGAVDRVASRFRFIVSAYSDLFVVKARFE